MHLGDGQVGPARGRDARARDELGAKRPADHPGGGERRDGRKRSPPVAGSDAGQVEHCQRGEDERGDAEQHGAGDRQVSIGAAEGVAHRLDADGGVAPVVDRIERAVKGDEEPEVEELRQRQQAEHRPYHPRDDAPGAGRQGDGQHDDDDPFEREPHECAGCEKPRLVRSDQGDPHHDEGEQCDHDGSARIAVANRSDSRAGGAPVPPQPPDVTSERLGKQGERDGEGGAGQSRRQDLRRRDRQRDSLCSRDDLAPVARRQRRAHPAEQPLGREERVARCPDREHPAAGRGGDLHAEGENQEGIDLAVQPRAQRRHRLRAPCDPSVDEVERERNGRERHERRDRRISLERSPRPVPRPLRRVSPG